MEDVASAGENVPKYCNYYYYFFELDNLYDKRGVSFNNNMIL